MLDRVQFRAFDFPHSFWTEARMEQLMSMWKDGLSATLIAEKFGGAVSRSAVLGKVHRLGLPRRRETPIRGDFVRATDRAGPRPVQRVIPEQAPQVRRMVSLLELQEGWCKYPIDVDGGVLFCAADQWQPDNPHNPYCMCHSRICFQPTRRADVGDRTAHAPTAAAA